MRSEAASACCRLALTRLNFFTGPYISSSAATNDVNSPAVSRPIAISRLPYQSAPAMAMPPRNSISGGSIDEHARHLQVGAIEQSRGALELRRLTRLGAERLDDAMAGERFAGDVRQCSSRSWLHRVTVRSRRPSRTSG